MYSALLTNNKNNNNNENSAAKSGNFEQGQGLRAGGG